MIEDGKPARVISPKFSISTPEISVGADYLFPNGLLLGGAFSYGYANYEFDSGSVTQFVENREIGGIRESASALGEPLDRSYDEYGFTLVAGYLKDPWAVLLTGRYARRDRIETLRREPPRTISDTFVVQAKGDTAADLYSGELGVSYRVGFENGAALTGLASILYQREEIDSYTDKVELAFEIIGRGGELRQVPKESYISQAGTDEVRKFNSQKIESIPLEVGALFSIPFGDGATNRALSFSNFNLGATYTHDFDDQKRTVKGTYPDDPARSVEYEEENRNQDFISVFAALDFNILNVAGTLSYQRDQGFDEREWANIISLQLRVPLSF